MSKASNFKCNGRHGNPRTMKRSSHNPVSECDAPQADRLRVHLNATRWPAANVTVSVLSVSRLLATPVGHFKAFALSFCDV